MIEFFRRSHIAKTMMIQMEEDIEIKENFLFKLKDKLFVSKKLKVSSFLTKYIDIDKILEGKIT
jgi:hypothetical protein